MNRPDDGAIESSVLELNIRCSPSIVPDHVTRCRFQPPRVMVPSCQRTHFAHFFLCGSDKSLRGATFLSDDHARCEGARAPVFPRRRQRSLLCHFPVRNRIVQRAQCILNPFQPLQRSKTRPGIYITPLSHKDSIYCHSAIDRLKGKVRARDSKGVLILAETPAGRY